MGKSTEKSAVLQGKKPLRTGEKVAKIQVMKFLALGLGVVLYLPDLGIHNSYSQLSYFRALIRITVTVTVIIFPGIN